MSKASHNVYFLVFDLISFDSFLALNRTKIHRLVSSNGIRWQALPPDDGDGTSGGAARK